MNTESKMNYYEVLDISENATQQEIHMAYERARKTYSAENKALQSVFSQEEASELRRMIDEAFEVLSNDNYRNVYEKRLLAQTFSPSEMSAEAIKTASDHLFQRVIPPVISTETLPDNNTIFSVTPQLQGPQQTPQSSPLKRNLDYENEIAAKKDWSGEDLRRLREYKQLSLDELTDITKINPWYIAAIETMDPKNLPVEVFVRGYVLQIAKALGAKEKIVTESYMRLFRKKIEN